MFCLVIRIFAATNYNTIMKRSVLLLILVVFVTSLQAKTTYIPTYYNRIYVIENGQMDSLLNHRQMLQMDSRDNLLSCFVVQQVVSSDLIKAIKQAKRAAGWAMVASSLSAASAGFSEGQLLSGHGKGYSVVNYVESRDLSRESSAISAEARAQAEELKALMVDLQVRNNSEKEMLITDMDRGLVWFVLPKQEATLPLAKGEESHFRISSCSPLDENVKYINVSADSYLEKYTIALETAMCWYVPVSEKVRRNFGFDNSLEDGYIRINKETMDATAISTDDFKEIKDNASKP